MTTRERMLEFEERFIAWYKATREHPEIKHGAPPDPADFGLSEWTGNQIKHRVIREMERST